MYHSNFSKNTIVNIISFVTQWDLQKSIVSAKTKTIVASKNQKVIGRAINKKRAPMIMQKANHTIRKRKLSFSKLFCYFVWLMTTAWQWSFNENLWKRVITQILKEFLSHRVELWISLLQRVRHSTMFSQLVRYMFKFISMRQDLNWKFLKESDSD